jgi:hypothetical protein
LRSTFRVVPTSISVRVEEPSTATPTSVYDALMDLDRWSDFMPGVSAASWEVCGAPDTGVGGVRRIRLVVGATRDRIVDGARPHHHVYTAVFPWYVPLKNYRGDIRIEGRGRGSLIVWTVSCMPRVPGLRNLNQALERNYARLAAGLAREAERRPL